jgi:phospholipid/cholesterol/gamma-HCH transport system substrate-binding protein
MTTWVRDHLMLTASAGVVALLLAALVMFPGGGDRTVTAHFDRAVAVYPGTDLRVMGVQIGEVTAVVPDGNSVRVEMTYDSEYALPADAKAAVVTPTLIADRYVQVFPAYADGAKLADDADIPLARTQTPVELDRMYKALDDLSTTLGPKGGSTRGALDNLLTAGTKALDGNGELGSKAIRDLSRAADTFARNRGPLFDNVRSLAEITETLAANDALVQNFVKDLTKVSGQLEGERDEIRDVLEALAGVLGTVEGFVEENREVLNDDITLLGSLLQRVDNQKDALGILVQEGSLALGNLALAFDSNTGSFGSRLQATQQIQFRPDQFICQILTVNAGAPATVCPVIYDLLQPILPATKDNADTPADAPAPEPVPEADAQQEAPSTGKAPSLLDLLGGGLG